MKTAEENAQENGGDCSESLAPVGQHVFVQSSRYRCLGYCDRDGRWHNAFNGELIADVVGWTAMESKQQ